MIFVLTLADDPEGKTDQLRFPRFHTEMLEQTWVNPAQALGRVKVVIAEGTRPSPSSGFEKIRNVVAFAFQHAPLRKSYSTLQPTHHLSIAILKRLTAILEDTGIAWPNRGMWYQAISHFDNPLSPAKVKPVDPDSHAHSPRRQLKHKGKPTGTEAHPSRILPNPFIDDDKSVGMTQASLQWQQRSQGIPPYSADVTMRDRSVVPSGDQDLSMPDYSRANSPESLRSLQMMDYSRPPSFTSAMSQVFRETYFTPSASRQGESRRMSDWEQAQSGIEAMPLVSTTAGEQLEQTPTQDRAKGREEGQRSTLQTVSGPEDITSFFDEGMAAYTPGRVAAGGTRPPANTRVSSAAHSPPAMACPSAARNARESSYSGKQRVSSITGQEVPASQRSNPPRYDNKSSRIPTSTRLEHIEPKSPKPPHLVQYSPSGDIKGRKEGKLADIELDVPQKHHRSVQLEQRVSANDDKYFRPQSSPSKKNNIATSSIGNIELDISLKNQRSSSRTSTGSLRKDSLPAREEAPSPDGQPKRRKISRTLLRQASTNSMHNENSSYVKASQANEKTISPVRHNDVDDLTPEGIITRSVLGELDDNVI